MAPISLNVSRDTFFHDYLEFFSKLVHEENRFHKMPYDSWKKLSYWAADTRYSGFQIYDKNYTSVAGVKHNVWCIQPTSSILTVPNAEEFEKDDNSFGSFLSHHARKPMFVSKVNENGKLTVIDIFDGEEKNIMLARSPFGFDFITKVVSFIDFTSANTENPFGNMLPLLMLSNSKDNMLPFLLLAQNNGTEMNPMMMYALMSDNQDMLPLLMCMSANKPSK